MAVVIVNFGLKAYSIDNGNNANAIKIDNVGGGTQRTHKVRSFNFDVLDMKYQLVFQVNDTDDANGYDGPPINNLGISGDIDPSWFSAGKVDVKLMKIDAINKLLRQLENTMDEAPLTATGTVTENFI